MDACYRGLSGLRAWARRFLDALPRGIAIPGIPGRSLECAGIWRLGRLHLRRPGTVHHRLLKVLASSPLVRRGSL